MAKQEPQTTYTLNAFGYLQLEQIYLNHPENGLELYQSIQKYMPFYTNERRHTELENKTPYSKFNRLKNGEQHSGR